MLNSVALAIALMAAQFAQVSTGELRVRVTDQSGAPVQGMVEVASAATAFRDAFETDQAGMIAIKRLPFGRYEVAVQRNGFAPFVGTVEVRSVIPLDYPVMLTLAPLQTQVSIAANETLLDTQQTGAIQRIGAATIQRRLSTLPGRALTDLINAQPGWLVEANGVLHPRGSEYEVQYVIDGLPLTDNRSPAFAADVDAADARSVTALTGGYPAEYGRKLGGVIEVVSAGTVRHGLHSRVVASGGSFATYGANTTVEYGWPRGVFTANAGVEATDRYLDPPVEENFTNHATTSHATVRVERDLTGADRFGAIVRRGHANFVVPNERAQEDAGQRQDRNSRETMGQFSYQRTFSAPIVADVRGMVRHLSAGLWSNEASTPVAAFQDRGFREVYVKASVAGHAGVHEWKAGGDLMDAAVRERFWYHITAGNEFASATPVDFAFNDRRPDREQALFVQDRLHAGPWTVDAGMRWDHYGFIVREQAVSPRVAVARAWTEHNLVVRASYDRAFQTPAFENLLLASSPAVELLARNVVRLPVQPAHGHFLEAGVSKTLFEMGRLDTSYFVRRTTNFADDDLLLNTGVSFPIAFDRAVIRGVETRFEVPRWRGVTASASYGWMDGTGSLPITGGIFLGDDSDALDSTDTFPISQDQRHTIRGQVNYQATSAIWLGGAVAYGSGLPFEFDGDRDEAVEQYGSAITDRVNFATGRARPFTSIDLGAGALIRRAARGHLQIQARVGNVFNRLGVINFAGLFSGTALAPPRNVSVRLIADF